MRRFVRLTWVAVFLIFLWLLPSTTSVSHPRVEGVARGEQLPLFLSWLRKKVRGRRRRTRISRYAQIYRFIADYCEAIWSKLIRQGFVDLESGHPQTVQQHRLSLRKLFVEEALLEGYSLEEIMEGICGADVHEIDEAALRKDRARLSKKRRTSRKKARVWWPISSWIPQPGELNDNWLESYRRFRPFADRFVREKVDRKLSGVIMWYFDAFHTMMGRVWILLRDCHYEELVFEAIAEGVDARDFYVDAIANIEHGRIRMKVMRAYEEAVARGEQESVEIVENSQAGRRI